MSNEIYIRIIEFLLHDEIAEQRNGTRVRSIEIQLTEILPRYNLAAKSAPLMKYDRAVSDIWKSH